MWRCKLTELNWVSTKMLLRPEWMQFEIGMSIRRYLPAIGTAGLLRDLVSGKSRVPRPPPRISAMTRGIVPSSSATRGPYGCPVLPAPDHVRLDHLARAFQVAPRRLHVQPYCMQLV